MEYDIDFSFKAVIEIPLKMLFEVENYFLKSHANNLMRSMRAFKNNKGY